MTNQLDMFASTLAASELQSERIRRTDRKSIGWSAEEMVECLEATGDYRVLRRLAPRSAPTRRRPEFGRLGVLIDTETTGLDHRKNEIIEIGAAWACSVSEIDWSARGFEGTKLGYLVGQAGYFHVSHRAVDDCFALLEVLDHQKAEAEKPFAELLRASERSRARLFAEHSPFDMKDHLKARGYRWSDGSDGRPKSWWIEVDENLLADELHFLRTEIYRWDDADPPVQHLTALERYKA